MEKLKLKDFLAYRYLSAPEFAPDGKICAFVAAQAKEDESGYDRDIWLFDPQSERVRPLTAVGTPGNSGGWMKAACSFPRCAAPRTRSARSGASRSPVCSAFASMAAKLSLLHHPRARERPARAG